MVELETPQESSTLYRERGDEVDAARPYFTGDVFNIDEQRWILIQHPCAMRRGVALVDKLLVAPVRISSSLPTNWSAGFYKLMPLPAMCDTGDQDYAAHFADVSVVDSSSLDPAAREITLSQVGVNLLMQRWIYHNCRVVVPTIDFHRQFVGPFEEADLASEWITAVFKSKDSHDVAYHEFDKWLSDGSPSRRELLSAPQTRSGVRRELRSHLIELTSQRP